MTPSLLPTDSTRQAEQYFSQVVESFNEISLLETTAATLGWDERTGLPKSAGEYRARQISYLSGLIHERRTAPKLGEQLMRLADSHLAADCHSEEGATIRCLLKDFQRQSKLNKRLVEAIADATVRGEQAWATSRKENNFAAFLPFLERIIHLRKEEASHTKTENQTLYDALLDQYEEGATIELIEPVLNDLRDQLVPLVQRCSQSNNPPSGASLAQAFDIPLQRKVSRWIAERIGYQFSQGRLDETDHPFCTSLGPNDHRILTRYDPMHFSSGFFGTLHEAGHAIYEQGLSKTWFGLPPGSFASLGIHESQSRLWENMVGRSFPFWKWCFPEIVKYFPNALENVSLEDFYRDINRVQFSLIRVDADEVTYNLHILIRFELEQALFSNQLSARDLPEAWRDKYKNYLGIEPQNDREGVLQDVHWSAGLFGYFPTYTLGNIYAAQMMEAATAQIKDSGHSELTDWMQKGNFSPLLEWLRTHVHVWGRRLRPRDLVQQATSKPFSAKPLVAYLEQKIDGVYC